MQRQSCFWLVVASKQYVRFMVHVEAAGRFASLWERETTAFGASASGRSQPQCGWLIAQALNEACAHNLIAGLVLLAPRRLRRNILEGLDRAVAVRIVTGVRLPGACRGPTRRHP